MGDLETRLAKLKDRQREIEAEIQRKAAQEAGLVARVLGGLIAENPGLHRHVTDRALAKLSGRERTVFAAWLGRFGSSEVGNTSGAES